MVGCEHVISAKTNLTSTLEATVCLPKYKINLSSLIVRLNFSDHSYYSLTLLCVFHLQFHRSAPAPLSTARSEGTPSLEKLLDCSCSRCSVDCLPGRGAAGPLRLGPSVPVPAVDAAGRLCPCPQVPPAAGTHTGRHARIHHFSHNSFCLLSVLAYFAFIQGRASANST